MNKVSWHIVGIQLMTHVFVILGEKGDPVIDYTASLNWEQCPSKIKRSEEMVPKVPFNLNN